MQSEMDCAGYTVTIKPSLASSCVIAQPNRGPDSAAGAGDFLV
jgi:hypothetical protein